jgi:hypothetical protein
MLTQSQIQAVKAHVALDERTQELIRLARADLYNGPNANHDEDYPGFAPACHLISEAFEATDLYLDTDSDEVMESEPDEVTEFVVHLDSRDVVRYVVGKELARYV